MTDHSFDIHFQSLVQARVFVFNFNQKINLLSLRVAGCKDKYLEGRNMLYQFSKTKQINKENIQYPHPDL